MTLRACLLAGLTTALASGLSQASWNADDLPNPLVSPEACGRTAASRICDPEGYLQDSTAVDKALRVLEKDFEYPGCGAYEMGIAVVGSVSGEGSATARAEKLAKDLMDRWGVGKAACNNGIVLVLAIRDRQSYIATGRGASKHLSDDELQHVIERMKPLLKEKRYPDAAEQSIADICRVLSGESLAPSRIVQVAVFGFFLALVGKALCDDRKKNNQYKACKRKLTQLEQDRADAKAKQYNQQSCPICLELFEETKSEGETTLACGHRFHKSCIAEWEDRSSLCPICRASPAETQETAEASVVARRANNVFQDEFCFRLQRARHFYPDYVTNDMVTRWSDPSHSGQLVADTSFVRRSPNYTSSNGAHGDHVGSSGSFGGGCSSGGGGAGGGW